ncbi:DUF5677 domain-containing protein [Stappia indica]|uniref:DUF5677 domain-containing protein n=1 Tax=Stappia indica TaxID=538381 RepID=UPI00111239DF|nr:DUF5677 domain-containing protein [Stappia indica]
MSDIQKEMRKSHKILCKEVERSLFLIYKTQNIFHTGRQLRSINSFSKAISHGIAINSICIEHINTPQEAPLLDHFSIGALTRVLIESCIMTLYISDLKINVAQWDLRRQILFLHDATNRKRFLTALLKTNKSEETVDFIENYQEIKFKIIQTIKKRSKELNINEDKCNELTKGNIVYIDGIRGAAREAGIDINYFEFMQSYLSNHIHSHPVSTMRMGEHNFSFEKASDFQINFCTLCFEACSSIIKDTRKRMKKFTGGIEYDPVGILE